MKSQIIKYLNIQTLVLFSALWIYQHKGYAQQDPMYSQYMFNTLIINPAYAGSRDVLSATALHRRQWINVDGAPVTTTFSIDAPVKNEKIGLGLTLINDNIGVSSNTGIFANYAYRIRLKNSGTLAMGLSAGASQFRANLSAVKTSSNGSDFDPAFSENQVRILPNFGAGLYYTTDKIYIGLSLPHLLNNKLANDYANFSGNTSARQFRHLFLSLGGVVAINNNFKLKPSLLYKYVNAAPMQLDLNCNFWFYDILSIGASYRTNKTVVGLVEIQATPQFRIGYAYDINFSKTGPVNTGSHEIMMRYEFAFKKKKFLTPRYF